jgi:hypothetical protein
VIQFFLLLLNKLRRFKFFFIAQYYHFQIGIYYLKAYATKKVVVFEMAAVKFKFPNGTSSNSTPKSTAVVNLLKQCQPQYLFAFNEKQTQQLLVQSYRP